MQKRWIDLGPNLRALLATAAIIAVWGIPRSIFSGSSRSLTAALEQPTLIDSRSVSQVLLWLSVAAIVMLLHFRPGHRSALDASVLFSQRPILPNLIFAMFAVMSAAWSVSPAYTVYDSMRLVLGIALFSWYAVAFRRDPLGALRPVFIVNLMVMLAIAVLLIVQPSLVGRDGPEGFRLSGGIFSDYGGAALVVGTFALAAWATGTPLTTRRRARFSPRLLLSLYGLTWVLLLLSRTRSSMAAALATCVFVLAVCRNRRRRQSALVVLLVAAPIAFVAAPLQSGIDYVTRGGQGLATLSGRTEAFRHLQVGWREHPILGGGFGAGSRTALAEFPEESGLGIGAAHDALSATLTDVGLAGAAILAFAALVTVATTVQLLARERRLLSGAPRMELIVAASLIMQGLMASVTSRSLAGYNPEWLAATVVVAWLLHFRQGALPRDAN